jgi:hypothetical protein
MPKRPASVCRPWWRPATGASGWCRGEGKDRGRTLAHIYGANGDNLEAQLLAEALGFAWHCAQCRSCRVSGGRKRARQARLGCGAAGAAAMSSVRVCLVSGRGIERNRGGVWIELQGAGIAHCARLQRNSPQLLDGLKDARSRRAAGCWIVRARAAQARAARWVLPLTDPACWSALIKIVDIFCCRL